MSRLLPIAIALLLLSQPPMLIAESPDPRMGTWTLRQASRITPDGAPAGRIDQPQMETLVYQPTANGFKWVFESSSAQGRTHSETQARLDGAAYPVATSDSNVSVTRRFRQLSDRTYTEVTNVEGLVTATRVVEISPDGNTLTAVDIATNNPASAVLVFQKQ